MDLSNLLRFPSQFFFGTIGSPAFSLFSNTTNQNETVKKRSSLTQRWLLPINFPLKHKHFGKAAVTWCVRLAQFWGKYEKQFQRWSVSSGRTWEVVLNRLIERLIVDCQWLGRTGGSIISFWGRILLLPQRSVLKVKFLRRGQDPHNWSWTNGTKIEAVKCFWQSADPWYETLHLRDDSDYRQVGIVEC